MREPQQPSNTATQRYSNNRAPRQPPTPAATQNPLSKASAETSEAVEEHQHPAKSLSAASSQASSAIMYPYRRRGGNITLAEIREPDRKNDWAGRRNKKTWQILQFFEIEMPRSNGISTPTGLRTARFAMVTERLNRWHRFPPWFENHLICHGY